MMHRIDFLVRGHQLDLPRWLLGSLFAAVALICPAAGTAGEEAGAPGATKSDVVTRFLADDFENDTRSGYEVDGPIDWQPGRVVLSQGGSLGHALDAGVPVELTVRLAFSKLSETDPATETRLRFVIDKAMEDEVQVVVKQLLAAGNRLVSSRSPGRRCSKLGFSGFSAEKANA